MGRDGRRWGRDNGVERKDIEGKGYGGMEERKVVEHEG